MTQPEYLTILVSIIVGLGITDLAQSVRDLLHPDRPVRWHWLPLTWAVVVILIVVATWWAFFDILQAPVWARPGAFLLMLFATLNLYFLCAFSLPDLDGPPEVDHPDRLDLESFYFSASHRRVFFGVAIIFLASFLVITSVTRVTNVGAAPRQEIMGFLVEITILGLPYAIMIVTDRKWVHVLLTIIAAAAIGYLLFDVRSIMIGG
jgi:hypothetical protein